ncbi:MAG: hypothetical protein JW985_02200 [Alphaproteobacteria bacterium]|nr:hypothetical protein [Alphaproteobacteria bacterium]
MTYETEESENKFPKIIVTDTGAIITIVHEAGLAMKKTPISNDESYGVYTEDEWKAIFTRSRKNGKKTVFSGKQFDQNGKISPVNSDFAKKWWEIYRISFKQEYAGLPKDNFKILTQKIKTLVNNIKTRLSK